MVRTDYEMFTPTGNRACMRLVARIIKRKYGAPITDNIRNDIDKEMDKVAKKHGEVHDTEPRNNILSEIEKAFSLQQFSLD